MWLECRNFKFQYRLLYIDLCYQLNNTFTIIFNWKFIFNQYDKKDKFILNLIPLRKALLYWIED